MVLCKHWSNVNRHMCVCVCVKDVDSHNQVHQQGVVEFQIYGRPLHIGQPRFMIDSIGMKSRQGCSKLSAEKWLVKYHALPQLLWAFQSWSTWSAAKWCLNGVRITWSTFTGAGRPVKFYLIWHRLDPFPKLRPWDADVSWIRTQLPTEGPIWSPLNKPERGTIWSTKISLRIWLYP